MPRRGRYDPEPTPAPPVVTVVRELVRWRDKRHVGTLTIRRSRAHRELVNPETGDRYADPVTVDSLIVTLEARGERVCEVTIPTAELMTEPPATAPPPAALTESGPPA